MSGEADLPTLLASLDPSVRDGEFAYVLLPRPPALAVDALVVEDEGVTVVVPRSTADANGWAYDFVAGWITLRVHSYLGAVGLTAAFATALASRGIACNVLAGVHHDHLLVPHDRVDDALAALAGLAAPSPAAPSPAAPSPALAVNVPVPPELQWSARRHDVDYRLTSITVRLLPDRTLAAKAYGRPAGGGRGAYVSFPVPDDPRLRLLVEDAARSAAAAWAGHRGPAAAAGPSA